MPLNKLDNFIKNTEGRILYVNPNDLEATDSIENQGNSLAKPFKTIQRALLESARFSYLRGNNNDIIEKTTILLFPGEHLIDNRPGFAIYDDPFLGVRVKTPAGTVLDPSSEISLSLESNFDLNQVSNILYKYNSVYGGVIVPRGTSIVGLDLRKTKIRPLYVPNPTDEQVERSAIFRVTGTCYFWQFTILDGDEIGVVYTDPQDFSENNRSKPTFSHNKLTCFEYADGVNQVTGYNLTDLDMYYSKVSNAYTAVRNIDEKFPGEPEGFAKQRAEWEIVGAFASDPISIANIESGSGGVAGPVITVTTAREHNLTSSTPIKIKGVGAIDGVDDYNISTKVQAIINANTFTYLLPDVRPNLITFPDVTGSTVTIETDTVSGASPYIFNISLRSVWGMCGMLADGRKASGFRSMVVAQFTGVSLQKDDRAFVKYNQENRSYDFIPITKQTGSKLSAGASSLNKDKVYHLDPNAIYRSGWETTHVKMDNDAIIQIVSVFAIGFTRHFEAVAGGDASITNSNSNFGQISLESTGFKREAFDKDNKGFITNIVTPRTNVSNEIDVDWLQIDVGLTTQVGISSHLYIFGFTNFDDNPPTLSQGFRIGARQNDNLFVNLSAVNTFIGTFSSPICMVDNIIGVGTTALGTTVAFKEYPVISGPTNSVFNIGSHKLMTGESVIINSATGDLPENIVSHRVYYVIRNSDTSIKLASSKAAADNDFAVTVFGGEQLTITSRVSDKESGNVGHPVQWDFSRANWFVHVNPNGEIYNALQTYGVGIIGEKTDASYVKRIDDPRSLDERIYKIRFVVPKESDNAKNPSETFIIQESSTTGSRNDGDFVRTSIDSTDINYNRNIRFIDKIQTSAFGICTVTCERAHDLNLNDYVTLKDVTSTSNTLAVFDSGFNGTFEVSFVKNSYEFEFTDTDIFGIEHNTGTFTNNPNIRSGNLPRFERNDNKVNLFVYRSEIIAPYIKDVQDGVYHTYVLNANNTVPEEFPSFKYSQSVEDLYPQLDKDNVDDNPNSSKTFAKRFPLGDVVTSDQKLSITRESSDLFVKTFNLGNKITNATTSFATSPLVGVATLTFEREHNYAGIVTYSALSGGSGYTNGTFYNVKLFNFGTSQWNGSTAKVVVSGGSVMGVDVLVGGSGYSNNQRLIFDTSKIGVGVGAGITVITSGISTNIGDSVQVTGNGLRRGGHYRIASVPSKNQVSIAITAGDDTIVPGQFLINLGPSQIINTIQPSVSGISTITTASAHGLVAGNKFTITNSNNQSLGDFLVNEKLSVNSFTVRSLPSLTNPKHIIRHGFSSNNAISDSSTENISARSFNFYDNDKFFLNSTVIDDPTLQISGQSVCGIATGLRFPLGTYIQIDNEIMRVSESGLSGSGGNVLTVIRGALGTSKTTHFAGSIARKIRPLPVELRRPSIIRASGHTFEYLGFGPGNYSTGLPQVQITTLTEKETFLVQAQKKSGGQVVYTGMNSEGEFYVGNKKSSSATGQESTFDVPLPTITGQSGNRLSVVFDEVLIKERLRVEGGKSGTVLSQFDGPVTFSREVRIRDNTTISRILKVTDTTPSTTTTSGAFVVFGGVGIGSDVFIGNDVKILGSTPSSNKDNGSIFTKGGVGIEKGLHVGAESTFIGISSHYADVHLQDNDVLRIGTGNDLKIYHDGNNTYIDDIGGTGDLFIRTNALKIQRDIGGDILVGYANSAVLQYWNNEIRLETTQQGAKITGILSCTDDIIAFISDERLKTNIEVIPNALDKVLKLQGFTYNFNETGASLGFDASKKHVGVSAQQVQLVLPEAVAPAPVSDEYITVKYDKIVPLLIEAIKELKSEIDELKKKL
jgi:hypothetical protein